MSVGGPRGEGWEVGPGHSMPVDPNQPIMLLFKQHVDGQQSATAAGVPYSSDQCVGSTRGQLSHNWHSLPWPYLENTSEFYSIPGTCMYVEKVLIYVKKLLLLEQLQQPPNSGQHIATPSQLNNANCSQPSTSTTTKTGNRNHNERPRN
eukprot:12889860-Ditylum_brightwellii.AAC.1